MSHIHVELVEWPGLKSPFYRCLWLAHVSSHRTDRHIRRPIRTVPSRPTHTSAIAHPRARHGILYGQFGGPRRSSRPPPAAYTMKTCPFGLRTFGVVARRGSRSPTRYIAKAADPMDPVDVQPVVIARPMGRGHRGPDSVTMTRDEEAEYPKTALCSCTPLSCLLGDHGFSLDEIRDGSAVVGMANSRVAMPSGVAGEQYSENCCCLGMHQLSFVPTRVDDLVVRKNAKALYIQFTRDTSKTALFSWQKEKVDEVVAEYQAAFNAKGIQVAFHQQVYYSNHDGGRIVHQFMTFVDLNVTRDFVPTVAQVVDNNMARVF